MISCTAGDTEPCRDVRAALRTAKNGTITTWVPGAPVSP